MKVQKLFAVVVCLSTLVWFTASCTNSKDTPPSPTENTDEHGHDGHNHHGHAKTPHGGHLIELVNKKTGKEEEFHAEWLHEDKTGKVTVYILDKMIKADYLLPNEEITITIKLSDQDPKNYQLEAVDATSGDKPMTAKFEIEDPELLTYLKLGEGVEATLKVDINGTPYEGKIEEEGKHRHNH